MFKYLRVLWIILLPLSLASCFIAPGKFISNLVIERDHSFNFSYQGEIYLLALTEALKQQAPIDENDFIPERCYDDPENADGEFQQHECSAEELRAQKLIWLANIENVRQNDREFAKKLTGILGDVDVGDPDSLDALVKRIEQQRGFEKVVLKENGVLEVDYRLAGRLGHDFVFPVFENMSSPSAFIAVTQRDDAVVRMDAPGLAPASGNGTGPLGLAEIFGEYADDGSGPIGDGPRTEGVFTLRTNGELLANNSNDGARDIDGMKQMQWQISNSTKSAPMALIQLDR